MHMNVDMNIFCGNHRVLPPSSDPPGGAGDGEWSASGSGAKELHARDSFPNAVQNFYSMGDILSCEMYGHEHTKCPGR